MKSITQFLVFLTVFTSFQFVISKDPQSKSTQQDPNDFIASTTTHNDHSPAPVNTFVFDNQIKLYKHKGKTIFREGHQIFILKDDDVREYLGTIPPKFSIDQIPTYPIIPKDFGLVKPITYYQHQPVYKQDHRYYYLIDDSIPNYLPSDWNPDPIKHAQTLNHPPEPVCSHQDRVDAHDCNVAFLKLSGNGNTIKSKHEIKTASSGNCKLTVRCEGGPIHVSNGRLLHDVETAFPGGFQYLIKRCSGWGGYTSVQGGCSIQASQLQSQSQHGWKK